MNNKRKHWKKHIEEHRLLSEEWRLRGYVYPAPDFPPIPEELRDMICGAKTKSTGMPCKRKDIFSNGRCKFHGGLSTGPKTKIGKKVSSLNGSIEKRTPWKVDKS